MLTIHSAHQLVFFSAALTRTLRVDENPSFVFAPHVIDVCPICPLQFRCLWLSIKTKLLVRFDCFFARVRTLVTWEYEKYSR